MQKMFLAFKNLSRSIFLKLRQSQDQYSFFVGFLQKKKSVVLCSVCTKFNKNEATFSVVVSKKTTDQKYL